MLPKENITEHEFESVGLGKPPADDNRSASDAEAIPWIWSPAIMGYIARFLDPNFISCTLRLVNKAASIFFSSYTAVQLSQPVPEHAYKWHLSHPSATSSMPFKKRCRLVCIAAASGSLHNLEVAVMASGCFPSTSELVNHHVDLMAAAAIAGHLHVCHWLRDRGCLWGKALSAAAGASHIHICEWLLANGCEWNPDALCATSRAGHVDLIPCLLKHHPKSANPRSRQEVQIPGFMAAVAEGCDLPTVEHLHAQYIDPSGPGSVLVVDSEHFDVLPGAISSRTPDWRAKFTFLITKGYRFTLMVIHKAEGCPDAVERLQWLLERGHTLGLGCIAAAAGNTTAVFLTLSNLAQRDDPDASGRIRVNVPDLGDIIMHKPSTWSHINVALAAAKIGRLNVLQDLHAAGCWFPSEETLLSVGHIAAQNGHLGTLAWLVEKTVALDPLLPPHFFTAAAESGNLELLKWLYDKEYPPVWMVDQKYPQQDFDCVASAAAEGGCVDMLQWLVGKRCPITSGGPYIRAAHNGDMATLRFLRRLGCGWGAGGNTFAACVAQGERFDENDKSESFTWGMCADHYRYAPLPVLRWLLAEGCPVDLDLASWRLETYRVEDREEVRAMLRRVPSRQLAGAEDDGEEEEEEDWEEDAGWEEEEDGEEKENEEDTGKGKKEDEENN